MDINERVDRIETKIENLENKFNDSIPEIQSGKKYKFWNLNMNKK